MTPTANAAVRWHPAPTPPPESQSMQEPPPPAPQRPDLTQLRQRLTEAEQESGALQDRRIAAEAAAFRLRGQYADGPAACGGMAVVGAGMVALATWSSLPLYMRVCMWVIGGGASCTGSVVALGCLACARSDQHIVAHDVSDEALDLAYQREQVLRRQIAEAEVAEAADIMMNLNTIAGPDVVNLVFEYAQELPEPPHPPI